MKVHFIAIGGAAMHNLAIALHLKGFEVSGSDDEIFEPSKSRLKKHNLLPDDIGWNPDIISNKLDAIILGMHARKDNPELLKAQKLGLKIYSYPEYIYQQSKNKTRVVIAGSHGKTTITAMILHVLNQQSINFDYMVGAQLHGFDTMVKLSDAPLIVLEGDEYLSSPIDLTPKFLWYKPHFAVITGIAWDHINVFETFEKYIAQFDAFAETIEEGGHLFFYKNDEHLQQIAIKQQKINCIGYGTPKHKISDGTTFLIDDEEKEFGLSVFGEHNLQNIEAALQICVHLGISKNQFYKSISSFTGAAKRLEKLTETENFIAFKDFAHSPSKLEATVNAAKNQYPARKIIAIVELHTFSSLNKTFLKQYKNTLNQADIGCVYYSHATIAHKKLDSIDENEVKKAFNRTDLHTITESDSLKEFILNQNCKNAVVLFMSSGNFGGLNLQELTTAITPN